MKNKKETIKRRKEKKKQTKKREFARVGLISMEISLKEAEKLRKLLFTKGGKK